MIYEHQIDYTLDLGEFGEREVTVKYTYSPGRAGSMYARNGDPGDPPEPAEIDIFSVIDNKTGVELVSLMPGSAVEYIEDKIIEAEEE